MDLSFYPLTMEAIDQAAAESLCLFIAADERPLTGLAGLADWRLSGKLSRLLRSGLLTGEAGEAVLTPPGARLAFQKLFLFGVGRSDQTEEQLVERVAEALRKLAQAGVQEAAMQLPARLSIDAGIRTLVEELQGPGRAMVFAPDPQKLVAALSHAATRASQPPVQRPVVKVPPPAPAPVKPQPAPSLAGPEIPKASPLPFAPQRGLPPAELAPLPPPAIPKASPLPFAPAAELLPVAPVVPPSEPPPAAAKAAERSAPKPPEPARTAETARTPELPPAPVEERKPAPPPPQRYVPPAPKPHVFEKGKRRKKT